MVKTFLKFDKSFKYLGEPINYKNLFKDKNIKICTRIFVLNNTEEIEKFLDYKNVKRI